MKKLKPAVMVIRYSPVLVCVALLLVCLGLLWIGKINQAGSFNMDAEFHDSSWP